MTAQVTIKKPLSAYMMFSLSKRQETKQRLMEEKPNTKIFQKDVVSECAKMWKALSADDKKPYYEEYEEKMALYKRQNTGHRTTTAKNTKPKFSVQGELPTTPEGFSDPINGYLPRCVKHAETGKTIQKKFADFNEAVQEAIRLGDACGGITRTSNGYSLRIGKFVKTDWKPGYEHLREIEYSWIKIDSEPTTPPPPAEEDDEEFQDALPDNITMIKNEVAQIASNMDSLISQMEALQEKLKILGDF